MNFEKRVTPSNVTWLRPNEIFVFGSNLQGHHGTGSAKVAAVKFGAKFKVGKGFCGQSYAIPTRKIVDLEKKEFETLLLSEIQTYVDEFISFAKANPHLTFLVVPIGTNHAGYEVGHIAPLFKKAIEVSNIHLPFSFWTNLLTSSLLQHI